MAGPDWAALVGSRVVVRRRTGALTPWGTPELSDVLGTLVAAREDDLVVRSDRTGTKVHIPRAEVVAGKPVPPRRTRSRRVQG